MTDVTVCYLNKLTFSVNADGEFGWLLPVEWYKCHIGAVVAGEKDAGSIAETWNDVLCVCGGWQ